MTTLDLGGTRYLSIRILCCIYYIYLQLVSFDISHFYIFFNFNFTCTFLSFLKLKYDIVVYHNNRRILLDVFYCHPPILLNNTELPLKRFCFSCCSPQYELNSKTISFIFAIDIHILPFATRIRFQRPVYVFCCC